MKKLIIAAMAALTFTAQAGFRDGNKLYENITSSSDISQMVALGYVIGVADSYDGVFFCVPAGVTAKQVVDVNRNYLYQHPEIRNEEAIVLVTGALSAVWPCATKPKQGGKTL